jgi:hypothetical protein
VSEISIATTAPPRIRTVRITRRADPRDSIEHVRGRLDRRIGVLRPRRATAGAERRELAVERRGDRRVRDHRFDHGEFFLRRQPRFVGSGG